MTRTIYALELQLLRITADLNEFGVNLSSQPPARNVVMSHYDGSYAEAAARAIYDACSALMKQKETAVESLPPAARRLMAAAQAFDAQAQAGMPHHSYRDEVLMAAFAWGRKWAVDPPKVDA